MIGKTPIPLFVGPTIITALGFHMGIDCHWGIVLGGSILMLILVLVLILGIEYYDM